MKITAFTAVCSRCALLAGERARARDDRRGKKRRARPVTAFIQKKRKEKEKKTLSDDVPRPRIFGAGMIHTAERERAHDLASFAFSFFLFFSFPHLFHIEQIKL